MTIVIDALQYLGYVLIFPGFLFCFLAGMLLCGIDRKLVAKMQKRVGPPLLQPFYDFFKLCGKETIVPAAAERISFMLAPLVGLAALVVIQLFIPVFGFTAFSGIGDIIVILYLLLIPALAIILGGAASGSPYAGVGLSREMVTVISCELPLVLVLLAVAKTVGSAIGTGLCFSLSEIAEYQMVNGSLITKISMLPAAAAMLLIIPGETGNHPFDAAEAETEICEGMLAEYSGAPLGVFKLSHAVKMLSLTSLFVALFLGGLGTGIMALDALLLFVLCAVITAKPRERPRCVSGMPQSAGTAAALVTPGMSSQAAPAALSASSSSPPRPKTRGSPPLRRTTRFPSAARRRSVSIISPCAAEGRPARLPMAMSLLLFDT